MQMSNTGLARLSLPAKLHTSPHWRHCSHRWAEMQTLGPCAWWKQAYTITRPRWALCARPRLGNLQRRG